MRLLAVALGILGFSCASNANEAALKMEVEAPDPQSREIGELIAPHLFQNGFKKITKPGDSSSINDKWRFVIETSSPLCSLDYFSVIIVRQIISVYNDANAMPSFTIDHMAQYDSVVMSFEERQRRNENIFVLTTGSIIVKPN